VRQIGDTTYLHRQGLKKCKFPEKLVKILRGPQVENDHPLIASQKESVFLKTLHSRDWTITAFTYINLDWFNTVCNDQSNRS